MHFSVYTSKVTIYVHFPHKGLVNNEMQKAGSVLGLLLACL
jgi:hypothetical protein